MRYGFTEDGKLATFSDLDQYFDPEKVLDLPIPNGRAIKVELWTPEAKLVSAIFGEPATEENSLVINSGKGGIECIQKILESGASQIYISPEVLADAAWYNDSLNTYDIGSTPESMTIERLQRLINVHQRSKRNKNLKNMALRNTVVRGILNVLTDASTQYNLQIPISMKEQQDAAKLSTMASEEKYLTSDNPSAKLVMQGQNMVGRDVIGIGAASLKAFFAASTYYNLQANKVAELLQQPASTERNIAIWNALKTVCFNAKFGGRTLVTLANINWDNALNALQGLRTIEVPALELTDVNSYLGDEANGYVVKGYNSNIINVGKLIEDLNKASNGDWQSPIDAAFSLSGLISAATDNAKELILAKINATSKFADIYTYLLSTGESFINIANFMTSPVFSVVASFAEGNMMDPSTRFFDLEHSLDFVLDEKTLPNVDNDIFMWILTNMKEDNFISKLLYKSRSEANMDWIVGFSQNVAEAKTEMDVEMAIKSIVSNAKTGENEYSSAYKALVAYVYKSLRQPQYIDLLLDYLRTKTTTTRTTDSDYDESVEYDLMMDDDYYMDAEDEVDTTKSYTFNYSNLKYQDWVTFYSYVKKYLKPKNQQLQNIEDLSALTKLRDDIIPALKEQRILSKILGVNQGLNTKDFDEYKWIRDIESFVNERYIDSNFGTSFEEFNFIDFVSDVSGDPDGYRAKQIRQYEQVKSTYNVLDIATSVKQFGSMIELAGINRKLIEKAYILKAERKLANVVLKENKKTIGKLSRGLVQKFNDKEYQVLKNFVQDLITINWMTTLDDVVINIPLIENNPLKFYSQGTLIQHQSKTEQKAIPLNTADGMATFKWMMEHYIVDKLKSMYPHNPFLDALSESYRIDKDTETAITFLTLPIDLGHADENSKTEQMYNLYLSGFNKIWKDTVPEELGIGDWTIGDLFYLYNLYVHKDGFGQNSLTRIFDNVVLSDDDNTLLNRYYKYISKLDSGTEVIEDIEQISTSLLNELRIALSRQNSSASKFRVDYIPATDKKQAEYKLMNADYSTQETIPVSTLNKSDYVFGFSNRYNPIKINVTGDSARTLQGKNKQKRKVSGREAMETVVKELQKAFGDRLPIRVIDNVWFESAPDSFKTSTVRNAKGFIKNGTIYVNVDNATAGTLVHEFMHVILAKMKYSDNQEERNLYYSLLKSIKNEVASQNEFWSKYWKQIESRYGDYAVGSDFEEEVFTAAVEDLLSTGFYRNMGVRTEDGAINSTFKEFVDRVGQAIAKLFAIPPQADGAKLLNMSLGDIIVDLSSGLFDLSGSVFMQHYVPINQKLAAFKRKLIIDPAEELNPDEDYITIVGDC